MSSVMRCPIANQPVKVPSEGARAAVVRAIKPSAVRTRSEPPLKFAGSSPGIHSRARLPSCRFVRTARAGARPTDPRPPVGLAACRVALLRRRPLRPAGARPCRCRAAGSSPSPSLPPPWPPPWAPAPPTPTVPLLVAGAWFLGRYTRAQARGHPVRRPRDRRRRSPAGAQRDPPAHRGVRVPARRCAGAGAGAGRTHRSRARGPRPDRPGPVQRRDRGAPLRQPGYQSGLVRPGM